MEKENQLLKKVGTRNPFTVPDGYFDSFTQEVMNKLPEKEIVYVPSEPTLWTRVKPWIYMTAMFCGIMLSVKVFVGNPPKDELPAISQTELENISEEEWETIIHRTMMDDYSLYQYLTEADFNID